jgi:hypothetical protein
MKPNISRVLAGLVGLSSQPNLRSFDASEVLSVNQHRKFIDNVSSIPEVVGDAGEYFDPYDLDSMSDAIEKVVYSEITASNLKRLGYERVKLFSWDLCAEQTNKIYQSLL